MPDFPVPQPPLKDSSMAKEDKHQDDDETTLRAAHNRAAISSWMNNNRGEHSVSEIADAVGLDRGTVGIHLSHMAANKLIPPVRKEGTSKMYKWPDDGEQQVIGGGITTPAARPVVKKKKGGTVPLVTEVEFVIGSTLFVLGHNPVSGRPRIILEFGALD